MNGSGGPGTGTEEGDAVPAGAPVASRGGDAPATVLVLAPDASAAGAARSWVVEVLAGWPEDSVDRARLAVSELVTNAVLHARTEITLRCTRDANRARFQVADRHRGGPVPKRYVTDSPTGRGVRLVGHLAESWGVERTSQGKAVWFTVTPETAPAAPSIAEGPPSLADLEMLAAALGEPAVRPGSVPPTATGTGTGMVHVQILGLPLEIYLEAGRRYDAVLRELELVERSPRRGAQVPPRLLELAADLRAFFAAATTSSRAQVEEALRTNQSRVNLDLEVPAEGLAVLTEMAQQLDEVDQFCRDGALLTLAASPRQRRFRHWYAAQVAAQVGGHPPTPWPDADPADSQADATV